MAAQISIFSSAFAVVLVLAMFAAVSAQELSSAPAPSPDAGAAFSLPVSGAVVGTSLVLSVLAFLKNH